MRSSDSYRLQLENLGDAIRPGEGAPAESNRRLLALNPAIASGAVAYDPFR